MIVLDEDKTKICTKCKKDKDLKEFYENKLWFDEQCHDTWCKKCIEMLVIGEWACECYFKQNRRHYPSRLWTKTYNRMEIAIELDKNLGKLTTRERRREIINQTRNDIFKKINNTKFYQFIDLGEEGTKKFNEVKEFEENEKIQDEIENEINEDLIAGNDSVDGEKYYSKRWHGFYTKSEIEYLEDYYIGLDNSFQLNNQSYIDYAKKVCKASLAMDNAFAEMQLGKKEASAKYKNFKDIFDSLSQSAKFAEKTRTENDSTGLGSYGQLIAKMENDGFVQKRIEFEDDDVDVVIKEFKYIITSVGESF